MLTVKRKVQLRGTSRSLNLTPILPPDWYKVRVQELSRGERWVTILIEKLE